MIESKKNRVKFKKGKQKQFLESVQRKLNCPSLRSLKQKYEISVSYSALKKYSNEQLLMSLGFVNELCKVSGLNINDYEIDEIRKSNWGRVKGGKIGIKILMKKYASELSEWRKRGSKVTRLNQIKIPKTNEQLSELIGVILGDGTVTKYFIRISGDSRYDVKYFEYLSFLTQNLFGLRGTIFEDKRKQKHLLYFQISSKKLCSLLHTKYNIPIGNKLKHRIIINSEIKKDKKNAIALIRGLVDTDGSVSRRGKQFCVQFTSNHKDLIDIVFKTTDSLGLFTYKQKKETGTNSKQKIKDYFKIIGSSNPRHIIRFREYLKGNKIYVREVGKLSQSTDYKELTLPYRYRVP